MAVGGGRDGGGGIWSVMEAVVGGPAAVGNALAVGGPGETGSACLRADEGVAVGSKGGGGGGSGASWRSRRTSCGAVEKNSAVSGSASCIIVGASERASEGAEGASEGASSSDRTSCMRAMSVSEPARPRGGSVANAEGQTRGPGSLPLPSGRSLRVMMVVPSSMRAMWGGAGWVVEEAAEWGALVALA